MTKAEAVTMGKTLVRGGMTIDKAMETVKSLYNSNGNGILDVESEQEIKSSLGGKLGREVHLTEHIREWISETKGNFSISDAYRDISSVTSVTNRNLYRVIINRLCNVDKIIQRVGNKDGQFRRVQKNIEKIDWLDATDDHLKLYIRLNYMNTHLPFLRT